MSLNPISFRLSAETRRQIEQLRDHFATPAARPSAADVLELALSRLAKKELTCYRNSTSGKSKKT